MDMCGGQEGGACPKIASRQGLSPDLVDCPSATSPSPRYQTGPSSAVVHPQRCAGRPQRRYHEGSAETSVPLLEAEVYGLGLQEGVPFCSAGLSCKLGHFCYLILHMVAFLILSAFPRPWFSYVSRETEIWPLGPVNSE